MHVHPNKTICYLKRVGNECYLSRIDEVWCAKLFPNGYKNLRTELCEIVCMQYNYFCTPEKEGVVISCDVVLPLFPSAKFVQ